MKRRLRSLEFSALIALLSPIGLLAAPAAGETNISAGIPATWRDAADLDENVDFTDFEKFTVPSRTDPSKRVRYAEQVEMLLGKLTYGYGRPKAKYAVFKRFADERRIPWGAYHYCNPMNTLDTIRGNCGWTTRLVARSPVVVKRH